MAVISLLAICAAVALYIWFANHRAGKPRTRAGLAAVRSALFRIAHPQRLRSSLSPDGALTPFRQRSGFPREKLGPVEVDIAPAPPIDFLAPAAEAGRNAEAAIKLREFDKAWRHYEEQRS